MEQLWHAFSGVIPLFFIACLFVILIEIIILSKRKKNNINLKNAITLSIINSSFYLSVIGILLVTLSPGSYQSIQLVPFYSIWDVLTNSVHYTVPTRILLFNIILFIPFGLFFAFKFFKTTGRIILTTTIIGTLFSILIENVQFIFSLGRTTNIDDVFLNMLGAFIGAYIGKSLALKYLTLIYNPNDSMRLNEDEVAERRKMG